MSATVCALSGSSALAEDASSAYREVTLADGRTYVGELQTTTSAGIRLKLPQGSKTVGFYEFRSVKPSTQAAMSAQPEWDVVVTGPVQDRVWVESILATYPSLNVAGKAGTNSSVTPMQIRDARACAPAARQCFVDALNHPSRWTWYVSIERPEGSSSANLRIGTSTSASATGGSLIVVDDINDPYSVVATLDKLMGLEDVPGREEAMATIESLAKERGGIPKKAKTKDKNKAKDTSPNATTAKQGGGGGGASTWVPVPGYTALKNDDHAAFGASFAVAVPATALIYVATTRDEQPIGQRIGLSAVGYYASCVVLNHILGSHSKPANASLNVVKHQGQTVVSYGSEF